jgi:hypothetical protein
VSSRSSKEPRLSHSLRVPGFPYTQSGVHPPDWMLIAHAPRRLRGGVVLVGAEPCQERLNSIQRHPPTRTG